MTPLQIIGKQYFFFFENAIQVTNVWGISKKRPKGLLGNVFSLNLFCCHLLGFLLFSLYWYQHYMETISFQLNRKFICSLFCIWSLNALCHQFIDLKEGSLWNVELYGSNTILFWCNCFLKKSFLYEYYCLQLYCFKDALLIIYSCSHKWIKNTTDFCPPIP